MLVDTIFLIVIMVMSVVVHEVSHGYAAELLGDKTARYAGRLTLNPIRHLDLIGSIIVPLILILSRTGIIIGWAKPVPVNPYNLRGRFGEAIVAIAGPGANIVLAILFGLLIRFGGGIGMLSVQFVSITGEVVIINLILAVFNLIPIPPLDGSKILFSVLPYRLTGIRVALERYGLIFSIIFIFFLWQYFSPLVGFLFKLITGISG